MEQIRSLILNLQSIGYRNYQIKNIVKSCIGTKKLAELTKPEEEKLKDCLAIQVDFALKCIKVTKEKG